mgnify:CR=1 FL=1
MVTVVPGWLVGGVVVCVCIKLFYSETKQMSCIIVLFTTHKTRRALLAYKEEIYKHNSKLQTRRSEESQTTAKKQSLLATTTATIPTIA